MRLVLSALGRPLTVIVALIAIIAGFFMAIGRMRMAIFPEVGNPVIYVAQPYGGMTPAQMEGFLTYYYEYHFLYITGIQAVDSKSVHDAALMKLTFREGTNMQQAMAETVGYVNRARAFMPPGTEPPFITRFDPGSVAVGLLLFTSNSHTQGELQNIALNQVRPLFATLPGVSAPPPFGGNQRTIVVTLDPDKLKQYGVSPEQAIAAVTSGMVVSPSGNLYDGTLNRIVRTNFTLGPELNDLMAAPIHPRSGAISTCVTSELSRMALTSSPHTLMSKSVRVPGLWLGTEERISAIVEMNHPGVWIMGDLADDDRHHGMGIVVEYAGYTGRAQWVTPKPFKWNYASFGQPHSPAQAPDETFDMTFAKDNAALEGFNRWTINGSCLSIRPDDGESNFSPERRQALPAPHEECKRRHPPDSPSSPHV